MAHRMKKICAAATAVGLSLAIPLATSGEAFGRGARLGGYHFGGGHFRGVHFGSRSAFGQHRFVGNFGHAGHGFAHAGLNHNAFGARRAWNAWNRGYGGYGGHDAPRCHGRRGQDDRAGVEKTSMHR
jgi:hypothetical protein